MRLCLILLAMILMGCATMEVQPPVPAADPMELADAQDLARRVQVEAELAQAHLTVLPPVPVVEPEEPPIKNLKGVIATANSKALMTPRPEWYARGTLYLPRRAGALYRLPISINQPCTIIFGADEQLLRYVGLEGRDRWTVVESVIDEGGVKQSVLVIIPNEVNLTGGLVLVTTKTVYNLQLVSQTDTGVLEVRWRYPEDKVPSAPNAASGIWHLGLEITTTQGSPQWVPVRAWDTGLGGKTIIEFPQTIEVGEAPLVFVPNASGQLEQVNSRKIGRRYIVDLVTPTLELRLGVDKAAEVVRITRPKPYRSIRCPGSPDCPAASEGGV